MGTSVPLVRHSLVDEMRAPSGDGPGTVETVLDRIGSTQSLVDGGTNFDADRRVKRNLGQIRVASAPLPKRLPP